MASQTGRDEFVSRIQSLTFSALILVLLTFLAGLGGGAQAAPLVGEWLEKVEPAELVPGADRFGPQRADAPVVPALQGDKTIGCMRSKTVQARAARL
jgi:NosR/NirI family transcriptional regulator, nitrous oxide reductase regulator